TRAGTWTGVGVASFLLETGALPATRVLRSVKLQETRMAALVYDWSSYSRRQRPTRLQSHSRLDRLLAFSRMTPRPGGIGRQPLGRLAHFSPLFDSIQNNNPPCGIAAFTNWGLL